MQSSSHRGEWARTEEICGGLLCDFASDCTVGADGSRLHATADAEASDVIHTLDQPNAMLQVELHVTSIHCISRADVLPFEVSDAARSEEEIKEAEAAGELKARVSQDVRLNGRYIDLRTAANQAIFKVQSGVCQVT